MEWAASEGRTSSTVSGNAIGSQGGRDAGRPTDSQAKPPKFENTGWYICFSSSLFSPLLTRRVASRRVAVAFELSQVLDTGLDRETLSILIALCENGVNPEALALVVKELKRESQDFRAQEYVS